ncbi:MAG: hypothetical protein PHD76_13070 [Methylacidiphilales bacterium]|nr:hypothetical protein [Candidatus Methylacidiphilales bacterium]
MTTTSGDKYRLKPLKPLIASLVACLMLITTVAPAAENPAPVADTTLSPFGIGGDAHTNRTPEAYAKWIPQMAEIGIHFNRTCATNWSAVEAEEGKWTWEVLDNQMRYLTDHGIGFGAILHGSGKWNTLDKPGTLPVNNLPAWSTYVSEVAKHVQGRVKYFEVWNEPPNGTGRNQTPADYAKIVVSAYDAVKAVDPTAKVGLAAKSVHVNYLDQAIRDGAKGHFDYVIFHPYEVLGGVVDNNGTEAIYMSIVPTVRKMLAARDPANVNVPVIFTELGCDAKKGTDVQAQAVVKAYTMGIAQGVTSINWFEGMDGDSGPMGLLDAKSKPRPAYTAMAQMIQHLGQNPVYLGWVLLNNKDYGFVFQGTKGTVLVTWAPKAEPDHVDFGQAVQIVDPVTGNATNASTYELTASPILVAGVPEPLVTQAQANKTQPFPWGGDYTNAKSVSIIMGWKNIEKGLHTRLGDSIARDVVAYGGSARAGNIPGGNAFMVDPNFLSYTSTPIEISIVIRRDPTNHPAKIELEYESTSGYKKLPVYEVPESRDWNTAKWKIDDAQFVSMWGFNFRYNSGSYYVQSVTVTKLQ